MKNKRNPNNVQPKNHDYSFTPLITTIAVPMLFERRKKIEPAQENQAKPKPKGLAVSKYELSENALKFFTVKGFPKKRWVLLKEVPLQEITYVESFGNELNLTWNGVVYGFVLKKSESFSALRDQIKDMLEDQRHHETDVRTNLIKSDLRAAINRSIDVIDVSFDILMGLNDKNVSWNSLENWAEELGNGWSFSSQTLPPLNLDFAKVSAAIKKQAPKEASKEAFINLKLIYEYFNSLKPDDISKESSLNFENAKDAMQAYYIVNDVLFGKVVSELDNIIESSALESVLLKLGAESNAKINFEQLKAIMDRFVVEEDSEPVIGDARTIFREQLKLL